MLRIRFLFLLLVFLLPCAGYAQDTIYEEPEFDTLYVDEEPVMIRSKVYVPKRKLHPSHEISLHYGLEIPLGDMYYVFKPASSYEFRMMWIDDDGYRKDCSGFTLGYFGYQPKQDTFYYTFNLDDYSLDSYSDAKPYGTVVYSKYQVFHVGVFYQRTLARWTYLESLWGVHASYYYAYFNVKDDGPYINSESTTLEGNGALGFTYGLNLSLNDHIGISYQPKATLYLSVANDTDKGVHFNSNIKIFSMHFSNQLGLYYRFYR